MYKKIKYHLLDFPFQVKKPAKRQDGQKGRQRKEKEGKEKRERKEKKMQRFEEKHRGR